VTVRLTVVTMTLHVPLETFSFSSPDNVNPLTVLEKSSARMTFFLTWKIGIAIEAKLLNELLRTSRTLLCLVSALRKINTALFLVVICDLNSRVAISLRGFHLKQFISVHVDDSDGDHAACLCVKNASHTDFFTEDSE
jgi:hypothetical protein